MVIIELHAYDLIILSLVTKVSASRSGNDMEVGIMGKHDIKLKSMLTATNVICTINNDGINNQMNGENRPLHLLCLISVDHTNSQLLK